MRALVKAILFIMILSLLGLGGYHLLQDDWLHIKEVEVSLNEGSAEQVLFERIQKDITPLVQGFIGQPIWDVNLEQVLTISEQDRRIRAIQVLRRLPDGLQVVVTPHRPVLSLLNKNNKLQPVAADGSLLPELATDTVIDLPILRGSAFAEKAELRREAINIMTQLPDKALLNKRAISEIHFDKDQGFVLLLSDSGTRVKLGKDQFGYRANLVERVMNYLTGEQLKSRVIDARFSKKVVVRLRNGT